MPPRDVAATQIQQAGTVPWRIVDGRIEVLLITSRGRGHWTLPKGNVPSRLDLRSAAICEAFEEAGVRGSLGRSLGIYLHRKQNREHRVELFALRVLAILPEWPESAQRRRRWMTVEEALRRIRPEAAGACIEALVGRGVPVRAPSRERKLAVRNP